MRADAQTDPLLKLADFRLFQKMMYEQAGIAMSDCKQSLVEGRLRKRLRQLGLRDYTSYYERLGGDAAELRICINLLTTNETYFFRHKRHWDFFRETILVNWIAQRPQGGCFRVWSAAASTGEEAYSAAILLTEALAHRPGFSFCIEASDINEDVLARARTGEYADYAVQKLTPGGLRTYFDSANGRHTLRQDVRASVRFLRRNLLEPSSGPAYDVVFLRNVIIYFDAESKARAVRNVAARLRRGGHLFLGGAESLAGGAADFAPVEPTIYQKR